jgi:hypothetical protein
LELKTLIESFHQSISLHQDTKPKKHLERHHFITRNDFHRKKVALRVRNFHFVPLSVETYTPDPTLLQQHPVAKAKFVKSGEEEGYYKIGVETALQALYLLNIPFGECIVQRETSQKFSVYSIEPRLIEHATEDEQKRIERFMLQYQKPRILSFGADIECLIRHTETKKFVAASSLVSKNGMIGFDDAIAVTGTKVSHPILELRPKPAPTGEQLYRHLVSLHGQLATFLEKNCLCAFGGGNPYGRFFIGGHLHIGNQPITFKHVRNLDIFLAMPHATIESDQTAVRRTTFGRFGNVRKNDFNGYEYRSLSSWYNNIPNSLPMLHWFQYLNSYPERLPNIDFTMSLPGAYYEHDVSKLHRQLQFVKEACRSNLPEDDFLRFALPFFRWIERKSSLVIDEGRKSSMI